MSAPLLAIYLAAPNDNNGNPRRGWLVVNGEGTTIEFVDEGYNGNAELRRLYPGLPDSGRIEVTAGFYNRLMKGK
jgi:hypothetical protein